MRHTQDALKHFTAITCWQQRSKALYTKDAQHSQRNDLMPMDSNLSVIMSQRAVFEMEIVMEAGKRASKNITFSSSKSKQQ